MKQTNDKQRIVEILAAFNVGVESISELKGPSTTLYEIQPRLGVRISKIRNLKDEIAVGLQSDNVRIIAPLPGKGTVGIEVPNKVREILPIGSLLSSPEFASTGMELPIMLGRTATNEILMADLARMPHLLIAGATGQGKSVCLNTILMSLMEKKSPDDLRIILIDPKQVEFGLYRECGFTPYIEHTIGTTESDAKWYLEDCVNLMEERYTKLAGKSVRNIQEYNAIVGKEEHMPYLVVIIDEYGDLIMQSGREMERLICRIAQKARAVGIHMIISTQRPSVKIVTGDIKANFPTRIAFRTVTSTDSKVVLGKKGAETLTGKGDMLFFNGEGTVRAQCAYTSTEFVKAEADILLDRYKYQMPDRLFKLPEIVHDDPNAPCDISTWRELAASGRLFRIDDELRELAIMATGYDELYDGDIGDYVGSYTYAARLLEFLCYLGICGDKTTARQAPLNATVNVHDPAEAIRICDEYERFYNENH